MMKNKQNYCDLCEKVIKHGIDVFGDRNIFYKWLECYCIAINDYPFNIMDSLDGLELIDTILYRIEYGVYS